MCDNSVYRKTDPHTPISPKHWCAIFSHKTNREEDLSIQQRLQTNENYRRNQDKGAGEMTWELIRQALQSLQWETCSRMSPRKLKDTNQKRSKQEFLGGIKRLPLISTRQVSVTSSNDMHVPIIGLQPLEEDGVGRENGITGTYSPMNGRWGDRVLFSELNVQGQWQLKSEERLNMQVRIFLTCRLWALHCHEHG